MVDKILTILRSNRNYLEIKFDMFESNYERSDKKNKPNDFHVSDKGICYKQELISDYYFTAVCLVDYYDLNYQLVKKVLFTLSYDEDEIEYLFLIDINNIRQKSTYEDLFNRLHITSFIYDLDKLIESAVFELKYTNLETETIFDCLGWIKDIDGKWTYSRKTVNKYLRIIRHKYIHADSNTTFDLVFNKLLGISNHRITIPLFAYTLLSIFDSILQEINMQPNFIITISSTRNPLVISMVSALCNLYNRGTRESSVQGIHACASEQINDLIRRSVLFKDGTYIIDGLSYSSRSKENKIKNTIFDYLVKYNNKTLNNVTRKFQKKLYSCPILITDQKVDNDFFYNIDVENVEIDSNIVKEVRENDKAISSIIVGFIDYIEKYINKKHGLERITETIRTLKSKYYLEKIDLGEREIEKISLLMFSFQFFLNYLNDSLCLIDDENFDSIIKNAFHMIVENIENTSNIEPPRLKNESINDDNWIMEKIFCYLSAINNMFEKNSLQDTKNKYFFERRNNFSIEENEKVVGWYEGKKIFLGPLESGKKHHFHYKLVEYIERNYEIEFNLDIFDMIQKMKDLNLLLFDTDSKRGGKKIYSMYHKIEKDGGRYLTFVYSNIKLFIETYLNTNGNGNWEKYQQAAERAYKQEKGIRLKSQ